MRQIHLYSSISVQLRRSGHIKITASFFDVPDALSVLQNRSPGCINLASEVSQEVWYSYDYARRISLARLFQPLNGLYWPWK